MNLKRLDILLCDRGLCTTREQAQARILAGEVWSGETRLEKAGMRVPLDRPLEVRRRGSAFVSRAGEKLQAALERFPVDVKGRTCLDIGASTGGFTDCLLKRGAAHVVAVDVGYGQLDVNLRNDYRVTVLERTNARFLTPDAVGKEVDFLCMDVSFISLRKIIEPIAPLFPSIRDWVLLFKLL